VVVRFFGRGSTARHGQAGSVTPDCLPGSTSSCKLRTIFHPNVSHAHILYVMRLGFVCLHGQIDSLGETGRSVNTALSCTISPWISQPETMTNVAVKKKAWITASCSCLSTAVFGLIGR
jgi:hypothetical protein